MHVMTNTSDVYDLSSLGDHFCTSPMISRPNLELLLILQDPLTLFSISLPLDRS